MVPGVPSLTRLGVPSLTSGAKVEFGYSEGSSGLFLPAKDAH